MAHPLDHALANPMVALREEFDDWAILYNPENADAVGVNPMGVAIWKRLDGGHGVDAIVAWIGQTYSALPETVADEVAGFIDGLVRRGFAGLPQPSEAGE